MKPFVAAGILFCSLMAQNAALLAQGVYVTKGENGPVFSDKPQAGAREVILQPLNVMTPVKESGVATPSAPGPESNKNRSDAAVPAYRSFSVVSPEDNGSVMANTALFEVRVAVNPPLQLGEGHAFVVSINGRSVGQRFTATEFMVPPEFWGDAMPPANQSTQLDASIVDANGLLLKKAAPVRFYLRYATILNNPQGIVTQPIALPRAPARLPKTKS